MKLIAASLLIASAAAFAPAQTGKASTALNAVDITELPGRLAENVFFDPLGFAEKADDMTMRRYREAELKHGRVAMLACFGMITADATSLFPRVFKDFSNNPLKAAVEMPKLGWLQILTFIMFIEVIGILNSRRPDYEPGNFLGSSQWDTDAGWESYQTKELNNGRLAMFGAIGMLTGSYITGKGPIEVMVTGDMVVF